MRFFCLFKIFVSLFFININIQKQINEINIKMSYRLGVSFIQIDRIAFIYFVCFEIRF